MRKFFYAPAICLFFLLSFHFCVHAESPPVPFSGTITSHANLRIAPSFFYDPVETIEAGESVTVIKRNPNGNWCRLSSLRWILCLYVKPPTLTTDNADYVRSVMDISVRYVKAVTEIGDMIKELGDNPELILDRKWKGKTMYPIGDLIFISGDLERLTPPEEFKDAHDKLVEGDSYYRSAINHFAKAMDNVDAEELTKAISDFGAGNAAIVAGMEMIRSVVIE